MKRSASQKRISKIAFRVFLATAAPYIKKKASNDQICIYVDLDGTLISCKSKITFDEDDLQELKDKKIEYEELAIGGTNHIAVLRNGAEKFLADQKLMGKVKLLTSSTRQYAEALLKKFNLDQYFDSILTRENLNLDIKEEKCQVSLLVDDLDTRASDIGRKLNLMNVGYDPIQALNSPDEAYLHNQKYHIKVTPFHGQKDNELETANNKIQNQINMLRNA